MVVPYLSMHPKFPEILVVTHCQTMFREALDFKGHSPSASQIAGAIDQLDLLPHNGEEDEHDEVDIERGHSHSKM